MRAIEKSSLYTELEKDDDDDDDAHDAIVATALCRSKNPIEAICGSASKQDCLCQFV